MYLRKFCLLFMLVGSAPLNAAAQTLINPDISAIADMRYAYRNDVAAQLVDQENVAFQFHELEVNISGYLNPYSRADVFLAIHGVAGPVELEEVYGTLLRGLPVQLRFGKYFLDFGRINQMHIHQMGWLERPLMLQSFFGEEGAQVIGIQASRLQGIGDTAVRLSLNGFRSDFFEHHEEEAEGEAEAHGAQGKTRVGGSGRLSLFRDIGATSGVEVGTSYLYAVYDIDENVATQTAGVDFVYKWVPDNYKRFKLMGEAVMDDREVVTDTLGTVTNVTAYGAFADAEVRFRKQWDVGAFVDWSESAFEPDVAATSYGGYIGFMPVEETLRFSVVYRYGESDEIDGNTNSVIFQVLWGLGPHKPHAF